ncbi:MAG: hypothetical protein DI533_17265 [Cereibacter sphaeroides]|uniref:Uncharacterized protein n=1 Tax=Cereibacter sphaeroides TaxID=1063 RepID=A0A2W5S7Y3_CERSP|nr:MAG: hypothetical protein DI533_17265 [Cereibacter sphaeroides]
MDELSFSLAELLPRPTSPDLWQIASSSANVAIAADADRGPPGRAEIGEITPGVHGMTIAAVDVLVSCLVADTDRTAADAHPTGDLLRGSASFQIVDDRRAQVHMLDELAPARTPRGGHSFHIHRIK